MRSGQTESVRVDGVEESLLLAGHGVWMLTMTLLLGAPVGWEQSQVCTALADKGYVYAQRWVSREFGPIIPAVEQRQLQAAFARCSWNSLPASGGEYTKHTHRLRSLPQASFPHTERSQTTGKSSCLDWTRVRRHRRLGGTGDPDDVAASLTPPRPRYPRLRTISLSSLPPDRAPSMLPL